MQCMGSLPCRDYSVCILEGPCENREGPYETRAKDSGDFPDKQTKINPPNHPTPERPTLSLGLVG